MTLPYVVVRSNNVALSAIDELTRSAEISQLLQQLKDCDKAEQQLRNDFVAELYQLAGQDESGFRQILNFKAKLSSGKVTENDIKGQSELIKRCESGEKWLCVWQQQQALYQGFERVFEKSCEASRQAIRHLVQDEAFVKSISFARGDIYGIVRRYCAHHNKLNKKMLNDEDTIIKYLTRAIVKVSPFSSFTSIGFSKLDNDADAVLRRAPEFKDRFSVDRSVLLKIYDCLVAKLRSHWLYRFSANATENGVQKFIYSFGDNKQIYPFRSSLVKTKFPKLNVKTSDEFCYEDLASLFGARLDATYLHLLNNGILQFDIKLDDQAQDIILDFKQKIQLLKTRGFAFAEFETLLNKVHEDFLALDEMPVAAVSEQVDAITAKIHQLGYLVGYESAKKGGIVYHDTLHDDVSDIEAPKVESFASQVSEFITQYTGVNYDAGISRRLMDNLRAAMEPGQQYTLFEFYDLALAHLKQRDNDPKGNVGEVNKLLAFYQQLWQQRDTDIWELDPVNCAEQPEQHTMSAYGHVDNDRFILNCVDGGYLRVWSRFFTFKDDDEVLNACVDAYEHELKDAYDFYDTFGFNTGRRPRLAQNRIWLEQSDSCRLDNGKAANSKDLSLNQLYVQWHQSDPHPKLYSAVNGKEVVLRHTALFVSQLYPRLLEVLIRFSMMEKQSYFAPRFGIYDMVVQRNDDKSVKLPRVVYKDIVVSRKQWWFEKSVIPVRANSESLTAFLLRLEQWRNDMDMPSRVFIRRHSKDKVLQRDISNNKKPLFIDFHSPVMVRPISRLLNSNYDYISFEEMLPDAADDFMQAEGMRYASEIILEKVA